MITAKQKRCVQFIESVLPARLGDAENGHAAYEFIKNNLAAARKEAARQEREADRFILGAITQVPAVTYDTAISFRDTPARTETSINLSRLKNPDNPLWGLTAGLLPDRPAY